MSVMANRNRISDWTMRPIIAKVNGVWVPIYNEMRFIGTFVGQMRDYLDRKVGVNDHKRGNQSGIQKSIDGAIAELCFAYWNNV